MNETFTQENKSPNLIINPNTNLGPKVKVANTWTKGRTTFSYNKRGYVRSPKACVLCHNRKVKCDLSLKDTDPCTNCAILGKPCVLYIRKRRRANRGKSVNSLQNEFSKRKLEKVQCLDNQLSSDKKNTDNSTSFDNSRNKIVRPDYQKEFPRLSSVKLEPDDVLKEEIPTLLEAKFSGSQPSLSSVVKGVINWYQKTGQTRCYELNELDMYTLVRHGCFSIPDEGLAQMFIDNFFDNFNTKFPVVDKVAFKRDYKNLRKPPSLLLLNTIFYVGAMHCNTFQCRAEERLKVKKITEVFFRRAKAIFDMSLEADPVALVQSLLCFSTHQECMIGLGKNDDYWTCVAISVAMQYEYHRGGLKKADKMQKREIKRLWWLLVLKDRLSSLEFGRPLMIDLKNSTVPMLTEMDLQGTGMSSTEIRYTICLATFSRTVGDVIEQQHLMSRLVVEGRSIVPLLKRCDLILIRWLESIPSEFKFEVNDKVTHNFQAATLMFQYYALLMTIHQAEIVRNPNENYPSWAISFQAAQMIMQVLNFMVNSNMLVHYILMIHNALSVSTIIMSSLTYSDEESISNAARRFLVQIFQILKSSVFKWPESYPMLFALEKIHNYMPINLKMIQAILSLKLPGSFSSEGISNVRDPLLTLSGSYDHKYSTENYVDFPSGEEQKRFADIRIDVDKLFTDSVFSDPEISIDDLDASDFGKGSDTKGAHHENPLVILLTNAQNGAVNNISENSQNGIIRQEINLQRIFEGIESTETGSLSTASSSALDSAPVGLFLINKNWKPSFKVITEDVSASHEVHQRQYFDNSFFPNAEGFSLKELCKWDTEGNI
ncbi:hypothetical protein FOA43_003854 [Brettanomyces nanus]|uniref:Zn(2)-C6 fungal-type domain-containing protein n=1 Tax=Eeniella nana TaxID=13502 RepID=A0A875S8C8_EENNA|nr:uncharacterized protein FOA43_003854 [Brettanomyces nanus]QPG76465.1 hypothetical protein FOA43_003854 [Brettanomyces nanus]